MRRVIVSMVLAPLVVSGVHARSRDPVAARLSAQRLLAETRATWADDVAAFNRRTAFCDAAAARATAAYDDAHRTRFKRTLPVRWDAASSRWVADLAGNPEVALIFSGPVRSGPVTIDGRAVSFCRAEAPDRVDATAPAGDMDTELFTDAFPASPLGLDRRGRRAAYAGLEPATPRAVIAARIAKAQSLLEETLRSMDKVMADNRREADCGDRPTAERMAKDNGQPASLGLSTQYDKAGDAVVKITVRGTAYSGRFDDGGRTRWLCGAIHPTTMTASAMWQDEGMNVLAFTADVAQRAARAGKWRARRVEPPILPRDTAPRRRVLADRRSGALAGLTRRALHSAGAPLHIMLARHLRCANESSVIAALVRTSSSGCRRLGVLV